MTITKKPARPKNPEGQRDAIAAAFIQAADHRAKAESGALPKAPPTRAAKTPKAAPPAKAAKTKKDVLKKEIDEKVRPTPTESAAISTTKEKKSKDKDKAKDKGKKKKHKKKEAVIIRFEDAQLVEIDTSADALGLSRAAWVRMVVARALAKS